MYAHQKKMAFMHMENVSTYLAGCKALGIPDFESFQTVDLFEDKNMKAVVLNIHSLGRMAQKLGFAPTEAEQATAATEAAELAAEVDELTAELVKMKLAHAELSEDCVKRRASAHASSS